MDTRILNWQYAPDSIILEIFSYLADIDILKCGETCRNWNRLSYDEILWKHLFIRHYKLDPFVRLPPGKTSWFLEYKRLSYETPYVCSQVLRSHRNEVLHVSFSHDGTMFATSSKDSFIKVWQSVYPVKIKYRHDMKVFRWKCTQFSQFNKSDTLLLVSGVHFGSTSSTSGEIAVFSLQDGFNLQCRVGNKPYDIFGTWYNDRHLISGDLYWLARLISTTGLWINKASQETESEQTPILNHLFRFYNTNASSIRAVMVADCKEGCKLQSIQKRSNIIPSDDELDVPKIISRTANSAMDPHSSDEGGLLLVLMFCCFHFFYSYQYWFLAFVFMTSTIYLLHSRLDPKQEDFDDDEEEEEPQPEKLLIFTTGSKTYTPHQIGFKKIVNVKFPKVLKRGPSVQERLARRRERLQAGTSSVPEPNWQDFQITADKFDQVDHVMDLHGHIIGMGLSPDHRYLYVNSRPWPKGYTITNPLEPPPIAQEIDIHVIDLVNLCEVGKMLGSHKAYTPNNECFFIFLDVSEEYVASGAEDKHGYLWDRHYGICLAKLPHSDVVNSVAFNPKDSGMLVSTSDDFEIKVWRSKAFLDNLIGKEARLEMAHAVSLKKSSPKYSTSTVR